MSLYDDYQTLIRRGMPELADYGRNGLHWMDGHLSTTAMPMNHVHLSDTVARDLISMAAWRWLKALPPDKKRFGCEPDIASILAATIHLEPK